MKKRLTILAAFCYLAFINSSAQEAMEAGSEKKNYRSLVKIKTSTSETIEAAPGRRTPDTVYIPQPEEKNVPAGDKQIKILKESRETGVAVDNINSYKANDDTNSIYRDDLNKRKKQLKSKNTWKIIGKVALVVVALPIVAVCALAGSF